MTHSIKTPRLLVDGDKWIIQLCEEECGARYFSFRGKGITFFRERAAIMTRKRAEQVMGGCTFWPTRKVVPS